MTFQNPKALETLLAYNMEDVLNLERLMIFAGTNRNAAGHSEKSSSSKTYRNPYQPDHQLSEQILM